MTANRELSGTRRIRTRRIGLLHRRDLVTARTASVTVGPVPTTGWGRVTPAMPTTGWGRAAIRSVPTTGWGRLTAAVPTTGWGRRAAACAAAALTVLAAGCASTPLYGPAEPGAAASPPAASPSISLQLFKQAETGPAARTFQTDAATFNRDSRNPHLPESVLGEDAYQVSADISTWAQAMRQAPVPPDYQQAKARLLRGLALLQYGYRHIGNGLLYGDTGQIRQGRADVKAGSRILGGAAADVSL